MTDLSTNSSFDANGLQFAWDATSITLAEECLRKYQYRMIEGWSPLGLNDHIRFGAHYATALEHYYKRRAEGEDKNVALRAVVEECLHDTWDRETCDECNGAGRINEGPDSCVYCEGTGLAGGKPWQSSDPVKTRENLIRTIVWYADQFEDEEIKVVTLADGSPAVEYSFSISVDDDIIFAGHIDRLVEFGGDKYVMDQKTTKTTLSQYYFDQYSPHTQMSMYTFAGQMIYNIPVKGVIIDAAQIAVGFTRFARGFTFRTKDQLEEWYTNSLWYIALARHETARFLATGEPMPMNLSACGNYGGCPFRQVCSKSPQVRPQFLAGAFEKGERWDPLKRR